MRKFAAGGIFAGLLGIDQAVNAVYRREFMMKNGKRRRRFPECFLGSFTTKG